MADPQVRPRGGKHCCCKDHILRLSKGRTPSFRMRAMVDEADALSEDHEFSADAEIDHNVVHECVGMCSSEVDQKKKAFTAPFHDTADQMEYS